MTRVDYTEVKRIGYSKRGDKDLLAVEEPLEIRLVYGNSNDRKEKKVAVTMRTPGNDFELVTGFLFSEGVINDFKQIKGIRHCKKVKSDEEVGNVVIVNLDEEHAVDIKSIDRNFYTSSSCGVCGKGSIESIKYDCIEVKSDFTINSDSLKNAPDLMREKQDVFKHTGGLHATALFDQNGEIIILREDIGRHNAMDKVVGSFLSLERGLANNYYAVVSGRLSFELVQKVISMGLPIVAAIGAPSSLAVKLADKYQVTLIGFLKKDRYNIYTHKWRVNED